MLIVHIFKQEEWAELTVCQRKPPRYAANTKVKKQNNSVFQSPKPEISIRITIILTERAEHSAGVGSSSEGKEIGHQVH